MDLAVRTMIDALKTCDVDHSEDFIDAALCSALNSLLLSAFENESGIRELFDAAIVQVTTSENMILQRSESFLNSLVTMVSVA